MINTILIGRRLYAIVALIIFLLVVKLIFSYVNTKIIDSKVTKQQNALLTKMATEEVVKNLHLFDLGLRGYALTYKENLAAPYDSAYIQNKKILEKLKNYLQQQDFPMDHFYNLENALEDYYSTGEEMMKALKSDNRATFDSLMEKDLGYDVWLKSQSFLSYINNFEDNIIIKSREEYETEILRNYIVLILLILLIVPTLIYTAFHTNRAYKIAINLKEAEKEKKIFLEKQNEVLEKTVEQRTKDQARQNQEIALQNEEIRASNELLANQRDDLEIKTAKLQKANAIIENQNLIIRKSNQKLLEEVENQTSHLKKANIELVKRMSQLEEFAFIVSHKLRAPVARILGLVFLFKDSKNQKEALEISEMILIATNEMDDTIKEMNLILEIKNQIELKEETVNVKEILKTWISKNHSLLSENNIEFRFDGVKVEKLKSFSVFFENIITNFLQNAVKFTYPGRNTVVCISSGIEEDNFWISITDNGLGIDLARFGKKLFTINSRFHEGFEGKGMGLYVSKILAEHMHGKIKVTSLLNEGSTFTLFLPYSPPE